MDDVGKSSISDESRASVTLDVDRLDSWRPDIEGLFADPARAERLGQAAHTAYRLHFTKAHVFAAWRDVLLTAPAALPVATPEPERAAA